MGRAKPLPHINVIHGYKIQWIVSKIITTMGNRTQKLQIEIASSVVCASSAYVEIFIQNQLMFSTCWHRQISTNIGCGFIEKV